MFSLKKEETTNGLVVPPEMYHSVHVMQDDVDELHGKKPSNLHAERADAIAASETDRPFLKSDSPFSEGGAVSAVPEVSEVPVEPVDVIIASKEEKKPIDTRYLIYGATAILLVVALGAAAYYFFVIRKRSQPVPVTQQTETPATTTPTVTVSDQPAGYYSLTNPNTLTLDVESDAGTSEGVRKILSDAGAKVLSMQTTETVEFVVVDKSNTPIAFSRFAYLAGIKLPDDLLSLAGEGFSISMTVEAGVVRTGIAIDATDEKKMADEVRRVESTLPAAFHPVLYDATLAVPAQAEFHDGVFGTVPTRYVIVDVRTATSLDYVVLGKKLVIGTSRETFHSVLTKFVQGVAR